MAETRIKEIGVRKVLGASVLRITDEKLAAGIQLPRGNTVVDFCADRYFVGDYFVDHG